MLSPRDDAYQTNIIGAIHLDTDFKTTFDYKSPLVALPRVCLDATR